LFVAIRSFLSNGSARAPAVSYGAKAIRDILKVKSYYFDTIIPPKIKILKLLKLKIDLTTRALPQLISLIRVPFLAEMLGAILFFAWFH